MRSQIILALVVAFTDTQADRLRAGEQDPPNIVFIMADDVGVECLSCYGGESYKTPHLDELAKSGARFDHCYSMAVCHPTRVTLMTGQYAFRFKSKWGDFPNEVASQSIGHVMRRAGYATAVAGKWQITTLKKHPEHPHQLGFDEYCLFGWHEGPRYWQPLIWQNGSIREGVKDRYGPEVYCDFLIDFIKRNRERPFFAYYPMALCHDVTDDLKKPVPYGPGKERYDSFAEMVSNMDRMVGRLVAELDRLKLREKTLIVFTTDNGTPHTSIAGVTNDKLYREPVESKMGGKMVKGGKGTLKDSGTHVPLIVSQPGFIAGNTVHNDLVDFTDFLPTFAELGKAKLFNDVAYDGHSFVSRLQDNGRPVRSWALAEHKGKSFVRNQRWKLYSDGRLFDLKEDPLEQKPIDTVAESGSSKRAHLLLTKALSDVGWPDGTSRTNAR